MPLPLAVSGPSPGIHSRDQGGYDHKKGLWFPRGLFTLSERPLKLLRCCRRAWPIAAGASRCFFFLRFLARFLDKRLS
jgi:hypothetical protein